MSQPFLCAHFGNGATILQLSLKSLSIGQWKKKFRLLLPISDQFSELFCTVENDNDFPPSRKRWVTLWTMYWPEKWWICFLHMFQFQFLYKNVFRIHNWIGNSSDYWFWKMWLISHHYLLVVPTILIMFTNFNFKLVSKRDCNQIYKFFRSLMRIPNSQEKTNIFQTWKA